MPSSSSFSSSSSSSSSSSYSSSWSPKKKYERFVAEKSAVEEELRCQREEMELAEQAHRTEMLRNAPLKGTRDTCLPLGEKAHIN